MHLNAQPARLGCLVLKESGPHTCAEAASRLWEDGPLHCSGLFTYSTLTLIQYIVVYLT